ncbi:MAG: glycosyltransferase family 2 protein [bacterium]|nr:glycosyltransferase family 2 protein [bacterium]
MSNEGVSVIIPAYNEQGAITDTLKRVYAVFRGLDRPFEVIVVDDGSSDETGALAKNAGAIVITNPLNGGYGLSLRRGILEAHYGIIAITDADGTYPVEEFPKLLKEYDRGFAMVVGARQGKFYEGSLVKSFSRKVFRWLAEYTAGRGIPDINSGLRVFNIALAKKYLMETCLGFSFTTSLTLIFMSRGHLVAYMPIPYHARIGKSKVRHVRDALQTMQILTETIARYNPVKLFLLLGICTAGLAILFLLSGYLRQNAVWELGGLVGIFTAILVFAIGFIAPRIDR